MEKDNMYMKAVSMALKVSFLESREEFEMYVRAVYAAMKWAMEESKKHLL